MRVVGAGVTPVEASLAKEAEAGYLEWGGVGCVNWG